MHGYDPAFQRAVSEFSGIYYLGAALMNAGAAYYLWQRLHKVRDALVWLAVALLFVVLAAIAQGGSPVGLPKGVQDTLNTIFTGNRGAVIFTVGTFAFLVFLYRFRTFFVRPRVAWTALNLALLYLGLSMTSRPFWEIVAKPDNIPIVALIFLLGFFTWLATYKAVQNDQRAREGLPPLEKEDSEKVLVWPDLVYTELICMLALTAILLFWAILIKAPLEQPASRADTPNPSKAPWYFLGLQEMLVYYDPWMAGVVLPTFIIIGLMALPYIDFNKLGNGYYTIEQRRFSYAMFQIGFLQLWVVLIILGTFLRGPNWNFFGPYEPWDAHKVLVLNNVNLSDYFWIDLMGTSLPKGGTVLGILKREWLGIVLLLGYLVLLPPILAATVFRKFFIKMGFIRYMIMVQLLLWMMLLPIKMVLRWTLNLKYIIAIPEWFFNF